jgi:dimethylaniline monooxygenase (N-oxide forming)
MLYNTIIVGSGISGLFTLKHLIEEGITNVLILDKNPEPFGLWNINNKPSVFENTYTVSSKLYMTISDFPMPDDMPEFPHHDLILKYYKNYAFHFDLYKYIKQNCKVLNINKNNDIWTINTNNSVYYSTNIVIASGTVNDCPNIPNDTFYKQFKGEILHSNSFDNIKNIKNKKILIVGGSDTAVDCAMKLKDNNKITISIKNGVWFQNRTLGAYEPADMFYNRFLDYCIKNVLGKKYIHNQFNKNNNLFVSYFWGIGGSGIDIWKPKCDYLNSYYVKSREIIEQISKGVIIPENGIVNINNKIITFESNDSYEYDIILFCTGYKPLKCMTFLNENIIKSQKYKHIFYVDDPTLIFIGFIRPFLTSIPMITELQSRWISRIISNKSLLPSKENMNKENKIDKLKQKNEFSCSYERLPTIVDPYDYCNIISDKISTNIRITQLLFTNPKLLYMIYFGSWNHHVYRLNDINKEKRENAIKNIIEVFNSKISIKIEKFLFYTLFDMIKNLILYTFIIILIILLYKNNNISKKINKYYKNIK